LFLMQFVTVLDSNFSFSAVALSHLRVFVFVICHSERSREWSDWGRRDIDGKGRRLSERE